MNRLFTILLLTASTIAYAGKPARVVCIGDSITEGSFLKDPAKDSYPGVLQRLLGSNYTVLNCGQGGCTMVHDGDRPYFEDRHYEEALTAMPDIVTIMLGTNDSKPQNWNEETFTKDYDKLIRKLKSLPSHPDIYVCLPPPSLSDNFTIRDSVIRNFVLPVLRKHADHHWLEIIDLYTPLEGRGDLFNDGIHPNEAGAALIAGRIRETLQDNGWGEVPGKRILFIGDSITDGGWGNADSKPSANRNHYDMNHIYGHGYAQMCAAQMQARKPQAGYHFYNRGKGGDNLKGVSSRWEDDVLAVQPDLVSLLIGINDVGQNTVETFDFAGWEGMLRSVIEKTLATGADMVLCTPFIAKRGATGRRENYEAKHEVVLQLAQIVRRVAKEYNLNCVDFAPLIDKLVDSDRSGDRNYWMWDGIHPTQAAHLKMSELWLKKVRF